MEEIYWRETDDGKLEIDIANQDVVTMLWFAKKYKIDLRILLFLYEKYGKDLWFFFYLFAGMQVNFPSISKLLRIIKDVQDAFSGNKVNSMVGKFANELAENETLVISFSDREWFPFGNLGMIKNGGEEDVDNS
jgi:hypothetical protein